jgi:hypothetical protein
MLLIAETDCVAGQTGFELRYPTAKTSSGITAAISPDLAETACQRQFAFELLRAEYASGARTSGEVACVPDAPDGRYVEVIGKRCDRISFSPATLSAALCRGKSPVGWTRSEHVNRNRMYYIFLSRKMHHIFASLAVKCMTLMPGSKCIALKLALIPGWSGPIQ